MTMGHHEKLKTSDEKNAFNRWRNSIARYTRPGVVKRIKQLFNRRTRRSIKQELKKEI